MSSGSISILHGGHYTDQCLPLMGETDFHVVIDELDSVDTAHSLWDLHHNSDKQYI